jgi:quinol-cytochrome oxidoreductase complex cytochrome b subunit/mono/diheme cytochrome c family protein
MALLRVSALAIVVQLIAQFVAGVVLMIFYSPKIGAAWPSTEDIRHGDLLTSWLQGFHYWGSQVLILHTFLHLSVVVWSCHHFRPHRTSYVGSLIAFIAAFGFQATGNLLPMDRHDVQTVNIEASIAGGMPFVGKFAQHVVLQGSNFNQRTLDVWYLAHRIALPALAVAAIALLVVWLRNTKGGGAKLMAFVPVFIVAILGLVVAPALGSPATEQDFNSFDATVSWYTWPLHGALKAFAMISPDLGWVGAILLPKLFFLFLLALPILAGKASAPVARLGYLAFVGLFLSLGLLFAGPFAPISGNQDPPAPPPPPKTHAKPIDQALAIQGRELFNRIDCAGCHGKDGRDPVAGPNLTGIYRQHPDAEWYMRFIKNPTSVKRSSTMPAFPNLTDKELRSLAEFLRSP